MKCGRRPDAGFTLYEIALVLVVILAISAIVVPSVAGFLPSVRVRKAGDELIAAFSKAHADSVLTSRRFRVVFSKEPAAYRIEFEPDPMNEPATFRRLPGDWGAKTAFADGVLLTVEGASVNEETSEDYLEFSPDGTGPDARIVISNESGDVLTLEIDPTDGRARVVEEEPE